VIVFSFRLFKLRDQAVLLCLKQTGPEVKEFIARLDSAFGSLVQEEANLRPQLLISRSRVLELGGFTWREYRELDKLS
jgi:hypothetical protein